MKIDCAIGADHRGYLLKNEIIAQCDDLFEYIDVGTHTTERTDYPVYAHAALSHITNGTASCAILLCGTGTGMAIAANRYAHIYAAVAWSVEIARRAKEEDACNVLVLPADYLSLSQAELIIRAWHTAQFKEGRYAKRIALL